MTRARSLRERVAAYAAHEDPLAAACNLIALVVASNQPFYPLYVYWIVGDPVWPTFFTFLSTPFFLAVPAVARRRPLLGRALLPATGMANTVLSAKAFGEASAVEIFLMPCVLIAAAFFRPSERLVALPLIGLGCAIFFGLDGRYGAPAHLYSAAEYQAFSRLNIASAGTLVIFIGLILSGLVGRRS